MSQKPKVPKGVFSRSVRLAGMVGRLAAQEVASRVVKPQLQARIEQAKVITQTLSQLKGAAMKAGQLLSLDASDFLPKEVTEILSQLQAKATAHPTDEMLAVLQSELPPETFAKIKNFSEKPVASASIGQVHSAEIDGQVVAIKIQYPGVSNSVDADLKILKTVAETFLRVSGKKIDLGPTFAELREVLLRETDYEIELENLARYQNLLSSKPGYKIPAPLKEFSSKKVLTMTWMNGVQIRDWIKTNPPEVHRMTMAKRILDLFCFEFADWGFVQTDPNFGNFLVDGDQLVCLDFGAALDYDETFRKTYAELLKVLSGGTVEEVFASAVNFQLLDPREGKAAQKAFHHLMRVSFEPFQPDLQPFDFSNQDFETRTKDANLNFSKLLEFSPPPRRLLFLHRKLGGVFNLTKLLNVRVDLRPYWDKMIRRVSPNQV